MWLTYVQLFGRFLSMSASYVQLDAGQSTKCVIAQGTDDELVVTGFKPTFLRTFLFRLAEVVTLGLFLLWTYWKPSCRRWRYRKCPLADATIVFVENTYGDVEFCHVSLVDVPVETTDAESEASSSDEEAPRLFRIRAHNAATTRRQSLFNPELFVPATTFGDVLQTDSGQAFLRFFVFRDLRFAYDELQDSFMLLNGFDGRVRCGELLQKYQGWTVDEQKCRRQLFGANTIDVKVTSYWTLFYREVLNPFYVFQLCSLILWCIDDYYIYAICVLLITFASIGFELYETRTQLQTLRDMVSAANEAVVKIRRRDGEVELVPSADLVPGDVVVISSIDCDGYVMPCDALLLNGSCIVDESVLTGESAPIVKIAPSTSEGDEVFSAEKHTKHVLFCDTRVIQTRLFASGDVFALVVRTGFSSAKGSLIRDVLYPKFVSFEFYREAMLFLVLLAVIAVTGTVYSLSIFFIRGMHAKMAIIDALDIITIVVPPTLPAAMTVGIWYSQRRLKSKQIYSTSPQRINLCGKLNLICFDKTGTLTEEGLELNGVIPCHGRSFSPLMEDLSTLPFGPLLSCLTTCHNLTTINGSLAGEPLDLRMFESTGWTMDMAAGSEASVLDNSFAPATVKPAGEPAAGKLLSRVASVEDLVNRPPLELGIVRQFPFSPDLQRCTVVARRLGNYPMTVYCKGAPEQIADLCRPETIPSDFKEIVDKEALLGHRVLALAYRVLAKKTLWHHLQRMNREDLERQMEFLGVVVFRNRLKPPTTAVIDELRHAKIRCIMVTGDNLLTSLCVARECHMTSPYDDIYIVGASSSTETGGVALGLTVEPYPISGEVCPVSYQNGYFELDGVTSSARLAISGRDFALVRERSPDLLKQIVSRGVVFARMRPHQKAQLIETFQELGYVVGMCGDGANDCSALKAAHAGVSLSDLEASVAAPFTSRFQTIECIPALIKEGRCALVTSFCVFKYMTMYSMIQFASVLTLYSMNMFFADYMYLFIDLFVITIVAILMGRTAASDKLDRTQPSARLFSYATILSLLAHLLLVVAVQLGALFYLRSRTWFGPVYPDPNEELSLSWETTTLFFVSCYQYLIMALVFSSGSPYRKPFYTNYPFVFALLFFAVALTVMLFVRIPTLDVWLELIPIPRALWRFQLTLFLLALLNLAISLLIEVVFSYADSLPRVFPWWDKSLIFSPRSDPIPNTAFRDNDLLSQSSRADLRSDF